MLPAPARIAATPSPKSRASWNPAVPPPPVGGAAVRNGLAAGLRVADGLAEGLALALGVLTLAVLTLAVPLGRIVGVAEALLAGENVVGVAEGEDAEQAETDAEASMVNAAQLVAVSLALSPAPTVVVRIFMGPPHASGRLRTRSPVPHRKRNRGSARSLSAPTEGMSPEAPRAIKVMPKDGTDM
jgi:hypothetical protein